MLDYLERSDYLGILLIHSDRFNYHIIEIQSAINGHSRIHGILSQ